MYWRQVDAKTGALGNQVRAAFSADWGEAQSRPIPGWLRRLALLEQRLAGVRGALDILRLKAGQAHRRMR